MIAFNLWHNNILNDRSLFIESKDDVITFYFGGSIFHQCKVCCFSPVCKWNVSAVDSVSS